MQWISRVVGGWNVRMTRDGKRRSKFFADANHGGKRRGLETARLYRDALVAARPVPVPAGPRPLMVVRQDQSYCQIRVPKPGGGTTTTEFSARRHGVRGARRLALEAYHAAAGRVAAATDV